MFCKKCGHQNPDDAKFCMSCGMAMAIVQEIKTPIQKVEIKEQSLVNNKPNAFQKILLLISLVWFVVALFYTPYKDDGEIVYDVLWANRSEKVDLLRVLMQFGLLLIATYILYHYLRRFNTLEKQPYKKLAKRELYLFFLFVFSIFACGLYLSGTNFINKKSDQKLAEQIAPIEQLIEQNSQKRKKRSAFWDEAKTVYDLGEFDNKINRYWDFLVVNMDDEEWLNRFYNSFNKKTYNYNYGNNYEKKYYVDDEFNSLKRNFSLNTPNDLKNYIRNYSLTADDFKKDEENKTASEKLNKMREEKAHLTFYNNKDFRRISLISLVVVFFLLYVLRPLFWFVKGLFTEIK